MTVFADIRRYIPQREPMLMVDRLLSVADDGGQTQLTIGRGNMFLDNDDCFCEFGLIEHIAQSASAVAGYRAVTVSGGDAPVGLIAEVKHFKCNRLPVVGETLVTQVVFGLELAGITLVRGTACVGGEVVAEMQMKIYM